ncbi:hypothetical protein MMC21_005041 [Puttea exsequens]|nr:hypothetical protein [Puttea exsequens]
MPRSIPKRGILPAADPAPPPSRSRADRNRETALYHADLIQQRKDVEDQILFSTETLLNLPSSLDADPVHPATADAALAKDLLRTFQPSDYDALIVERNINRQCGYIFCPKPNRLQDTDAKYRILPNRGKGHGALQIIEKQKLERWCSDDCSKKALYIKVQLDEEPAWTRISTMGGISLLGITPNTENDDEIELGLAEHIRKLNVGGREDDIVAQMKTLAVERGDLDVSRKSSSRVDMKLQERSYGDNYVALPKIVLDAAPPNNAIEGYTPKFQEAKVGRDIDGCDTDIMDTI